MSKRPGWDLGLSSWPFLYLVTVYGSVVTLSISPLLCSLAWKQVA